MFRNNLKVKIDNMVGDFDTRIILYYQEGEKIFIIKPLGKLTVEEYKPGVDFEPTLSLDNNTANDFFRAMAEVAEERGILTEKQEKADVKTAGILESTKYHLEDMRKLVFKEQK